MNVIYSFILEFNSARELKKRLRLHVIITVSTKHFLKKIHIQ